MDTLLSMRVFRHVVEQGSFVAAAGRLQLSTAMVSKHVMQLEKRLGTRLLNRSSRHLSLTEAGSLYLDQCRDLLDTLDEVEASIGQATVNPRGTLRISAPAWFANPLFARVLCDYQQRYPDVRLDIDLSGRLVNLVEEGFDLALRVTLNPGPTLIARPLGTVTFLLVAAPAYLQQRGIPASAAALAEHAILSYALLPTPDTLSLQGPEGPLTLRLRPALRCNTDNLLREAALAGAGLAFLPGWLIDEDVRQGRLHHVLPDITLPAGQLYAVYASRRHLSSKVRTFVDFMAEPGRLG